MRTALFCLPLLALTGCMSTYGIRPQQLSALDGFDAEVPGRATRVVETVKKQKVVYAPGRELGLVLQDDTVKGGEFLRIEARAGTLRGTLKDGREVSLELRDLKEARLSLRSPTRTAMAVLVPLSAIATLGLVVLGLVVSHLSFGLAVD